MKPSKYVPLLILIVITALVSACGGSGSDSNDPVTTANPVAKAGCVLGTSTIGECKI